MMHDAHLPLHYGYNFSPSEKLPLHPMHEQELSSTWHAVSYMLQCLTDVLAYIDTSLDIGKFHFEKISAYTGAG